EHYLSQIGSNGTGNGELINPHGIRFDSSGDVYIVDTGNNRVEEFDPSGNYILQFGSANSTNPSSQGKIIENINETGNGKFSDNTIHKHNGNGQVMGNGKSGGDHKHNH
ncbi:MAG: hypothetical protein KGH76_06865, partial [Thaumarchaeota archaeon]|nr:hypothetical protein [Nitrososphaerota archaeon]